MEEPEEIRLGSGKIILLYYMYQFDENMLVFLENVLCGYRRGACVISGALTIGHEERLRQ